MEVTINYNGQAVAVEVTLEVYEFLDRADHKTEETYKAIDVAMPATDTIIQVNDRFIQEIPDRSKLMRGTPILFRISTKRPER